MKRLHIQILVLTLALASISGCKAKHEKIDLSSTHTTSASVSQTTSPDASDIEEITSAAASELTNASAENQITPSPSNVSADLEAYKSGKVSIEYPVLSNMESSMKEEKANALLKGNALSILQGYNINEAKDSLSISCNIISIDRKRITVSYSGVYTASGAAYPLNVYYSNSVNLNTGTDITLSNYADAATLAGYILSSDCKFYQTSADIRDQLLTYRKEHDVNYYTHLLQNADFPLKSGEGGASTLFPESFSYEYLGDIYITIPVSHALGDYATIVYSPETK